MSINTFLQNFGIFSSSPKGKDYQLAIANQRELNKASSASGGYSLTETMACNSTQDSLPKDPPKGGSILRNLWQTAQNSYEFTKDLDQGLQVIRPHVEKVIIPICVTDFAIIGGACGTVGGGLAGFGAGAIPGGGLGFLAGGLTGFIVGAVLSLGLKVAIATRVITVLGGTLHFLGSVAYQGANGTLDKAYGACYAKTAIGEIKQNTGTDLSNIITSTPQRTLKDPGVRAALGNQIGKELDINNECGPFRVWLDKEPVGALIHLFKHYENQEIRKDLRIELNHHQAAEVIASMDGRYDLIANEKIFKLIYCAFPQRNFEDYVCDCISKSTDDQLPHIVQAITNDQQGRLGVFPSDRFLLDSEMGRIPHKIFEEIGKRIQQNGTSIAQAAINSPTEISNAEQSFQKSSKDIDSGSVPEPLNTDISAAKASTRTSCPASIRKQLADDNNGQIWFDFFIKVKSYFPNFRYDNDDSAEKRAGFNVIKLSATKHFLNEKIENLTPNQSQNAASETTPGTGGNTEETGISSRVTETIADIDSVIRGTKEKLKPENQYTLGLLRNRSLLSQNDHETIEMLK